MNKIPLSKPDINEKDIKSVVDVLRTPNLSLGPRLIEFEKRFSNYTGRRYGVAVNSGTSGLHLCVKSLGIKEEDEVITTPFSFISSANCVLFERARPLFCDIDEETLNIDAEKIEELIGPKTRAILPVHIFGVPCDMKTICRISDLYNIKIIEDSCEALGAEYKLGERWKKTGSFGDASVFAFYPNKQMTTGEGGIILCDKSNIAEFASSLRNQGREEGGKWIEHIRLGYNYRISDINCALGISQLERIDEMLSAREKVAFSYKERLSELDEYIKLPFYGDPVRRVSWFVYVIRLKGKVADSREKILGVLREKGISCSSYFQPIHLQKFYREKFGFKPGDFPVTEKVAKSTIALPFYNKLTEGDIDRIASTLRNILRRV